MGMDYVWVRVDGRPQLMPIQRVREILPMVALQNPGEAAGNCRGFLDLRGEVLPVFDLTAGPRPSSASEFILVLDGEQGLLGLVVQEVREVIRVEAGDLIERPLGDGRVRTLARCQGEVLPILEFEVPGAAGA